MHYQDHLTKVSRLRPLKTKSAICVAVELYKIFCDQGAPKILQSDNGKEFLGAVKEELTKLWPDMVLIHGRSRHPQSQGSVERANRDVETVLGHWTVENNYRNWPMGCYVVEYKKNCRFHSGIQIPSVAAAGKILIVTPGVIHQITTVKIISNRYFSLA
jgi:hypothetical protein